MEADKLGPGPSHTIILLDCRCRVAPSARFKAVCRRAPSGRIPVRRVAVVPQICSLGYGSVSSKQGILACLPVDQLPDGWEEAQAFVDDCGQEGHILENLKIWTCAVQHSLPDPGIKPGLRVLHNISLAAVDVESADPTRLTGCFAKRYSVEIMHSCGFSWPATKETVRLSRSCFSFHCPEFLASIILRPSPSGAEAAPRVELCPRPILSSCLSRFTS